MEIYFLSIKRLFRILLLLYIEVGMTGFEPATFCTQNKRATKLRYIPINYFFLHQDDYS